MNFYNENEEDKKGAPVIPGSASPFKKSAFGKQPMFSRAAGGIMDRLKNLSRKDLAFVGIGLSVLVMAPVAEYMMSSSPSQDNLLKETFNPRSGPGGVMDPGINGLSTGSPDGSGEVITPLSQRDPMSLILGAQPAAAAAMPPSAPPVNNFRDAMKESGRAAFSEAAKSAGAPTVIPRMQSALRGMSSFAGEGGGSRTSGTIGGGKIIEDAQSASAKAKSRSMVGPVAMAGYKGVASNTPNSASKGAFEKLRSQADKSAGNFSGGSAMNSLDKAAAEAANVSGAGGLGAGGDSEKTGRPSGSTTKYDHNRSGESLEEAAAKARQQKALEWEFFKKYEFKKQLLTAVFGAISSEVGKWVGETVKGVLNPSGPPPPTMYCFGYQGGSTGACKTEPIGPISLCGKDKPLGECNCCSVGPKGSAAAGSGTGTGGSPAGAYNPANPQNDAPAAVTWPTEHAKDFDANLILLHGLVLKAEDKNSDPKKFVEEASKAVASLKDLTKSAFPLVVNKSVTEKAGEFNEKRSRGFGKNVVDARQALTALRSQNKDITTKLEAAKSNPTAIAQANVNKAARERGLKDNSIAATAPAIADAAAKIQWYIDQIAKEEKRLDEYETQLKFLERGDAFFEGQYGVVKAAAEKVRDDSFNIAKEVETVETAMNDYKGKLESATVMAEADMKKLTGDMGATFAKLTGKKVAIGSGAAPTEVAAKEVLVNKLLALRGADTEEYWKKVKINDDKIKEAEPKAWKEISPKIKSGSNNLADPLASVDVAAELKVAPALNIRAENELPDDLKKLEWMLSQIYGDSKGFIDQTKALCDTYKKDGIEYINPGSSTPASPTSPESPATPTSPVSPATPTSPVTPATPTSPVTPVTPTSPVTPVTPTSPVSPVTPTAPSNELQQYQSQGASLLGKYGPYPCTATYPDWPKDLLRNNPDTASQVRKYDNAAADIRNLRSQVKKAADELARCTDPKRAKELVAQMRSLGSQIDGKIAECRSAINEARRIQNQSPKPEAATQNLPRHLQNIHFSRKALWTAAFGKNGQEATSRYCDGRLEPGMFTNTCVAGSPTASQMRDFRDTFADRKDVLRNNSGVWRTGQIKIRVPDFSLDYSGNETQAVPLRTNTFVNPDIAADEVFKSEIGQEQYKLYTTITCRYSKQTKSWVIYRASLLKESAPSSNAWGGKFSAGWDLGVKLTGEISYTHVWGKFGFGTTERIESMKGSPCSGRLE
ncbi:MAG: hypothetical protein PHV36_05160 [Elusimicrobiales bacterium]|nr:hypothetical protein [Elusimicrobiales bacterium]